MNCQKTLLQRNLKLFVGLSILIELSSWQGGHRVIGHSGICTKHERYQKSRYVSYMETYRAKKWGVFPKTATRYNYRWEFYPDVRVVEECCHGYTSLSAGCVPVCTSGCPNGECYQPNVCKCNPGFVASLNMVHEWIECVPHCPDGCNGGECTSPGTCKCHSGYQSTKDRKSCVPSCLSAGAGGFQGCGENASCIAPNKCQCHDGYRKNPKGPQPLCLPVCTPNCGMNAFCASTDKCLCNAGHQLTEDGKNCVASCHSVGAGGVQGCGENASCIAPDECKCHDGYQENPKGPQPLCLPTCTPMCGMNAFCDSPNECLCNAGYQMTEDGRSCVPSCHSVGAGGVQGCGENASCIAPDECKCHDGYQENPKGPQPLCLPTCTPTCGMNAFCDSPNKCLCNAGYQVTEDGRSCVPSCHSVGAGGVQGCGENASCIAPDECMCHDGYQKNPKGPQPLCLPICTPTCGMNAFCDSPNKCLCNAGYKMTDDLKSCVASCHSVGAGGVQGCGENASCIAPNKCQCHDGYRKNPKGPQPLCLPVCTPNCGMNAFCASPDKCLCNAGHQLTEDGKNCVASCHSVGAGGVQGCGENASCIAPDECMCHDGYQKNPKGSQPLCLPTCTPMCGMNAFCDSPNKCLCDAGYQMTEDGRSCVPSCHSVGAGGVQGCGENASCIAPDECMCHDGYQTNPKGSQPLCLPTCTPMCGMNAFCDSPNKCLCNAGYKMTEDLKSCVASCHSVGAGGVQGCGENASCIAPNECQCHDGYQKNPKGPQPLCLPICTPTCGMNAFCDSPNKCLCNAGYQMTEDGRSCIPSCHSVGAGEFQGCGENASCIAPNTCKCHDGYQKNPKGPQPLCLPTCTPVCEMNAFCASPDKCLCNPGYVIETDPLLAVSGPPRNHEFTTVGTEPNFSSRQCKPLCEPECAKNSTCIAPDTCQCDPGYRSEPSSNKTGHLLQCDPVCDETCVNALCAYPNKCTCHLGYKPDPVKDFICEPICQDDCVNARCVQPDHCECYDGYVKKDDDDGNHETNSTNVCIPSCPGGCPNGKCVAPGQCACNAGYVLISQETTLDFSTTTDFSSTSNGFSGSYSTDSTDYSSTDSTDYSSTDSTDYYGTDGTSYSSSSTIAPISQQICQPLCEPECPSGSICIAPPNQCQRQTGINENSDDSVADRTPIKNDTTTCDRNANGTTCNAVESAIIGHTAASAIWTVVLLAAIVGLGAIVYLTLRKRRQVATHALAANSMGTMEKLTLSDPSISTEGSSYL